VGGAGVVLLIAYPLLVFISPGWIALLKALNLPVEVQDQVTVFSETKSQLLLAAMLLVACVLAPINEELLFRRGLYHYLRQKLHRPGAVLLSALLFGILHMNWAGFLPLMLLGALLALAYEWTGDIRVSIMTHALFNFTTVMMLFLGVPQPS
jgi:membrane protease YdiL (CAAX protease family)